MITSISKLSHAYNSSNGIIEGAPIVERTLKDLKGSFHDTKAYDEMIGRENPLVYRVSSIEPANGEGDLHYGLGVLFPGKVGNEYFMTKGHYHRNRAAAEVYIGLSGSGFMLLEDESTGTSRLEPLEKGKVVYVPGHTAHRTINTGSEVLSYFGVYPASAGHDYGTIAQRNFLKVLMEVNGTPRLVDRINQNL